MIIQIGSSETDELAEHRKIKKKLKMNENPKSQMQMNPKEMWE